MVAEQKPNEVEWLRNQLQKALTREQNLAANYADLVRSLFAIKREQLSEIKPVFGREEAIELARHFAVRKQDEPYEEYQPTPETERAWMPHEWVIDLILGIIAER